MKVNDFRNADGVIMHFMKESSKKWPGSFLAKKMVGSHYASMLIDFRQTDKKITFSYIDFR
tara:strand:+ start:18729 stop:18911 length:183 start_codon:yes stop_codon:yes gene_type:complete